MATTSNKIEKALQILKHQDFYWMMADYSTKAYNNAYSTMRSFVELVASIEDSTIVNALRELWIATYKYAKASIWSSNAAAEAEFKTKEAELMAVIKPYIAMAA